MKINQEQCMGCGSCLAWCPKKLLELSNDRNQKGVHYLVNKNSDECINCGICELMCRAGAIETNQIGHTLIDPSIIPPHVGCSFGSITKVLADVIMELGIQDQVVMFKQKGADIGLDVEYHDYTNDDFYEDGLKYKDEHPEKIVIIVCASSKISNTSLNEKRFAALQDEKVTIIHTLSYFEADENFTCVTNEMNHMIEVLDERNVASLIARGHVSSPKAMKQFEQFMKLALQKQINKESFSVVEMVYPCLFRLGKRPQKLMEYEKIQPINDWFLQYVESQYPAFIHIKE